MKLGVYKSTPSCRERVLNRVLTNKHAGGFEFPLNRRTPYRFTYSKKSYSENYTTKFASSYNVFFFSRKKKLNKLRPC